MRKSYRHGTEDSYRKHHCRCTQCMAWYDLYGKGKSTLAQLVKTDPNPLVESPTVPMDVPDIIAFLRAGRFNEVNIDQIRDEWSVTIKAHGDKFVGFGHRPEYAFYEAIKRYQLQDPSTGPITVTVDQATHETSLNHALADGEEAIEITKIWENNGMELEEPADPVRIGQPPIRLDE